MRGQLTAQHLAILRACVEQDRSTEEVLRFLDNWVFHYAPSDSTPQSIAGYASQAPDRAERQRIRVKAELKAEGFEAWSKRTAKLIEEGQKDGK